MITAPKKQYNHQFISRDIDRWLQIHFGNHDFNGRVVIGCRKKGGGIRTVTARSLSELHPYVRLLHISGQRDYYITANTVCGTQRNLDSLFSLNNIVIDVDCHEKDIDHRRLTQAFLWRAQRDLWTDGSFPCPNSIILSGRGVQLWWAIKPCHKSTRFYYDTIKENLMDHIEALLEEYEEELDGLQVDRGASSNAVGYFRLPCTYNTNAKCFGDLEILHSEPYDTHELINLPKPETPAFRKPEDSQYIPLKENDIIVLNNYYTIGARRVMQMAKLRQLRSAPAGQEDRDKLNLIVYCALRMAFEHEEARERLIAFNAGFEAPMTERELDVVIHTAKTKAYRYSNAKIIEFLQISEEEQTAIGLFPLRGPYRPYYAGKRNASRDAVRKALKQDRDHRILSMAAEGISQAETARILGISRTTVHKVIHSKAEPELEMQKVEEPNQGSSLSNFGAIYDCLLGAACSPGVCTQTIDAMQHDEIRTEVSSTENHRKAFRLVDDLEIVGSS